MGPSRLRPCIPDFQMPAFLVTFNDSTTNAEVSRFLRFTPREPLDNWDFNRQVRIRALDGYALPFGQYVVSSDPPTGEVVERVFCRHVFGDVPVQPFTGPDAYAFNVLLDCPPNEGEPFDCTPDNPEDCSLPFVFCDSIDFNNDGVFPDAADLLTFLDVYGGEPCPAGMVCNDIDFNNDAVSPDILDLDAFQSVFGGGPCLR